MSADTLGILLVRLRRDAGKSQQEVVKAMNGRTKSKGNQRSQGWLARIERGQGELLFTDAIQLSREFGVALDTLAAELLRKPTPAEERAIKEWRSVQHNKYENLPELRNQNHVARAAEPGQEGGTA